MCAKLLQLYLTLWDLWTIACQAPLSKGFSRQEYWDGLPCPPPGSLPNSGIKPRSPALAGGFFTTSATWEAWSRRDRQSALCQLLSALNDLYAKVAYLEQHILILFLAIMEFNHVPASFWWSSQERGPLGCAF